MPMRVKRIELYHVVMRLKTRFETSFGASLDRHGVLVKVMFDNGLDGWGEVTADDGPWYSYETVGTAWLAIRDYMAPILRGMDIVEPRSFIDRLSRVRGHNMAKAGLEEAVWDAYAKSLGKPLHELLGGVRDKIVSGVSIGIQSNIDELMKAINFYLESGYRRIKIKIKPGWDVNVVKQVRREYPDIPLQVDANSAYSLSDARIFREMDDLDLLLIEQPLDYDDLIDHAKLQRDLRTPICLDESIKGPLDARRAFELGSCKVINIKPGRVGGITNSVAIHDFCRLVEMPVWIGGMLETGVGRGVQVALATLPNVKLPNDISASDRYYDEDITEPWSLNKDGTISVRKLPGIGVEPRLEALRKYSVKQEVIELQ